MSRETFLVLWLTLLAVMLTCRCLPLLLLRGRRLPERVERALSLIPAAAFAALVANDLVKPDVYAADQTAALTVLLASVAVLVVARKSGSLLWCAVAGMATYALLGMVI
ncbi:MAG: AzlD domain-containing protein [Atopobiaceae bacterium]|nr:AzlD domain-containing protein [Atopobiaceae bacterium]